MYINLRKITLNVEVNVPSSPLKYVTSYYKPTQIWGMGAQKSV